MNTRFDIRGERIACLVDDALRCFLSFGLDTLVIRDYHLEKSEQCGDLIDDNKEKFELD